MFCFSPPTRCRLRVAQGVTLAALLSVSAVAADPFQDQVAPLVKTFCGECHNAKQAEAELNLLKYNSAAAVADDFRQWEHVLTFVERGEMPPKSAKQQPSAAQRAELLSAIRAIFATEAKKVAGDPGVVLPRRLSNAEYDHSIRALTGVEIRPTQSFPVDPAAGEGFDNTGEALTMSPSLFAKLYSAAQQVADHALLTTRGVEFAPYSVATYADRAKFCEQAILQFYDEHQINYAAYLAAAWEYRHREKSHESTTPTQFAKTRGLSPKYFSALYELLSGNPSADKYYLGWLRKRWNELPPPNSSPPQLDGKAKEAVARLARDIATVSKQICPRETPAIVSNAGNGPIQHLDRRRKTAAERDSFDPAAVVHAEKLLLALQTTGIPTPADDKAEKNKKPPPEKPDPAASPNPAAADIAASGAAFCKLFPNRFYFVDDTRGLSAGFHLIEGFFRDDQPLCRGVLSEEENRELNRLWDELEYVTDITERMLRGFVFFERSERNFLKHADFNPFKEEDPKLVLPETLAEFERVYLARSNVKAEGEELRQHPIHIFFEQIRHGLAERQARLQQAQSTYLKDVEAFARRAYRRPLSPLELAELRAFFHRVASEDELGVEAAVRASLVRILVSPYFGFRFTHSPAGDTVRPLSDLDLASRLSFFLWSSGPDDELLGLMESGRLQNEQTLRAQVRRMLQSPRSADFAREFFGQWLGYRDFPQQEALDRTLFRDFDDALKAAAYEEPTRLAAHLIQNDLPITRLLDADFTFVNQRLAKHYGLPFTGQADDWRLTSGLHEQGRGGLLGMAVFLAKNSQPQRTSPVKRGFWVVHKLLGEHIPAPPADVVALPAKETDTGGKTIRELLALHVEDEKCARCHVRFDAVGLAMEGFDASGKRRLKDLAGRPVDNVVRLPNGEEARGVPAFASYLASARRDDFLRTLNRKLLGYALGRSLQLSDEPLLEEMHAVLQRHNDRMLPLIETIVLSPQFRNQRCRDFNIARFRQQNQQAAP